MCFMKPRGQMLFAVALTREIEFTLPEMAAYHLCIGHGGIQMFTKRGRCSQMQQRCMHIHTHTLTTHKCFVPHTLYHVTLFRLTPFTPNPFPASSFFPFQVFTAHLIPELFQGLIVSDAYNFTLPPHPAPSSYPHPLFLYFFSISLSITKLPPPGMQKGE